MDSLGTAWLRHLYVETYSEEVGGGVDKEVWRGDIPKTSRDSLGGPWSGVDLRTVGRWTWERQVVRGRGTRHGHEPYLSNETDSLVCLETLKVETGYTRNTRSFRHLASTNLTGVSTNISTYDTFRGRKGE